MDFKDDPLSHIQDQIDLISELRKEKAMLESQLREFTKSIPDSVSIRIFERSGVFEGLGLLLKKEGEMKPFAKKIHNCEEEHMFFKQRWLIKWIDFYTFEHIRDGFGIDFSKSDQMTIKFNQGKMCHRYIEYYTGQTVEEFHSENGDPIYSQGSSSSAILLENFDGMF